MDGAPVKGENPANSMNVKKLNNFVKKTTCIIEIVNLFG